MPNVNPSLDSKLSGLERTNTWTSVLGLVLLLALAAGLIVFYLAGGGWPHITFAERSVQFGVAVGILGLVLIFGLYVFLNQRRVAQLRHELIQAQVHEESLRSRLSELSSLFDVSGEVNLHLDLDRVLDLVCDRVLTCLEAERSSIFLLETGGDVLACHAASGTQVEAVRSARIPAGTGISGWVAENNEPLVLNDDESVRKFAQEVKPGHGIQSALCVPLAASGEVIGVLNVSRITGSRPFAAADARLLTVFAEHAASAIIRIRQYAALGEKAELLGEANRGLQRLNRMKKVFLATVNHELRGPLTSILAYAEFLTNDDAEIDETKRETFALILYEQARRLEELIVQITDLSRLEDARPELVRTPISINDVVLDVIRALNPAAAGKGVTLLHRLDPRVPYLSLDGRLIQQGLRTLVSNAIRYSEGNHDIRITTFIRDGEVRIEVTGPGIAIAPEDMHRVFQIFDSEDPVESAHIEGLALGLHLMKRVADLHGGRGWAEGSLVKGSSFYFTIPPETPRETAPPADAGSAAARGEPATRETQRAA